MRLINTAGTHNVLSVKQANGYRRWWNGSDSFNKGYQKRTSSEREVIMFFENIKRK